MWHSGQRGRFRYQMTRVHIQSSETFIEHIELLAVCRKDENKEKEVRIFKNDTRIHAPSPSVVVDKADRLINEKRKIKRSKLSRFGIQFVVTLTIGFRD